MDFHCLNSGINTKTSTESPYHHWMTLCEITDSLTVAEVWASEEELGQVSELSIGVVNQVSWLAIAQGHCNG